MELCFGLIVTLLSVKVTLSIECMEGGCVHIPDGFLDPLIASLTYAVFIFFMIYVLYRLRNVSYAEKASVLAVISAGIFAAQMLNWPIVGGTSLHFVGGALAGILLGPWLGALSMFLVLFVQCLVFHDGGITALGANMINMGMIDVLVGFVLYRIGERLGGSRGLGGVVGAFLGGWLGITLAGVACGLEIGLSSQFSYGWVLAVSVMGVWHLVLGVVEGVITAAVLAYLIRRAPELLYGGVD